MNNSYKRLAMAVTLSLMPIFPLWFSDLSLVARSSDTLVQLWVLQQGHLRQLHFTASEGSFTHHQKESLTTLYWQGPHVTLGFASSTLPLHQLTQQLEQVRTSQRHWAWHLDRYHIIALLIFLTAIPVWWQLWRQHGPTKH